MREMKESGISWIGAMPADWQTGRIKDVIGVLTDYTANGSFGDLAKNVTYLDYEDYARLVRLTDLRENLQNAGVYVDEDAYEYLGKSKLFGGEVLVANVGAYAGLFCEMPQPDMPATLGPNMFLIRTNNVMEAHYLYYLGNTSMVQEQLKQKAISSAQPKLNKTDVKTVYISIPSVPDQHRISTFLDSKCSEIDALTADIQTQIDTLEQYKRSVITEAVTKGLDKDVEMKESGIPFIGAIPAHWKSDKLKYHLQRNEPRNPGEQEVLSLYRDYGIVPKDSRDDNFNVTSEDTTNYKYVRVGDFVINKMKAWQGSVAVSDYEGIVSPAYYVYKFTDDNIYRRYFHYLLRACYKDEFMRLSGGIRVGQWDLSATALENTYILLPPYEEQVRIADYLDDKKKDIDDVIASKRDQLATLDAYKKSLIYEYVTGKKEVPAV